jgi:hypothetical protein
MKTAQATAQPPMSDNAKIQRIHDTKDVERRWNLLTKEERRFVLDGMNIGVNQEWILGLIEDAKEMRRQEGHRNGK